MLPVEFDAALAMIDTAQWRQPALKLRVLLHVKAVTALDHRDGAEIGVRTVAKALGTSMRSAGVVLDALLAEGVLVLVAGAAGSRAAAYAIEPRVARWRVPWAVAVETVEMRLDLLGGRLVEGAVEPETAFARVTDRAQPWRSRETVRALKPASARDGSRAKAALAYTPSRALGADGGEPAPTSYVEVQSLDRQRAVAAVCGAVAKRSGFAVGGERAERVAFAIEGLEVGPIIDAVLAAPDGLGLEMHVVRIEQLAALQRRQGVDAGATGPSWKADEDCPLCAGSGWEDTEAGARRCSCRKPTTAAPACETVGTEGSS